jgi:hypothetical protein
VRTAQIVFSGGLTLTVEHNERDTKTLAEKLTGSREQYVYLNRPDSGGAVFVNPAAVAYIEDVSN